jgi:hypothetical protein
MSTTKKNDMLAGFKENLRNSETPVTPMQTVIPVKEKSKIEETPFTLHIPTPLFQRIKILSATSRTSMKNLIIEALKEKYQE